MFKRKPKQDDLLFEIDPEEVLWDKLEEFNKAWKEYNKTSKKLRPWIDWEDKELTLSEFNHTRAYRSHGLSEHET